MLQNYTENNPIIKLPRACVAILFFLFIIFPVASHAVGCTTCEACHECSVQRVDGCCYSDSGDFCTQVPDYDTCMQECQHVTCPYGMYPKAPDCECIDSPCYNITCDGGFAPTIPDCECPGVKVCDPGQYSTPAGCVPCPTVDGDNGSCSYGSGADAFITHCFTIENTCDIGSTEGNYTYTDNCYYDASDAGEVEP